MLGASPVASDRAMTVSSVTARYPFSMLLSVLYGIPHFFRHGSFCHTLVFNDFFGVVTKPRL